MECIWVIAVLYSDHRIEINKKSSYVLAHVASRILSSPSMGHPSKFPRQFLPSNAIKLREVVFSSLVMSSLHAIIYFCSACFVLCGNVFSYVFFLFLFFTTNFPWNCPIAVPYSYLMSNKALSCTCKFLFLRSTVFSHPWFCVVSWNPAPLFNWWTSVVLNVGESSVRSLYFRFCLVINLARREILCRHNKTTSQISYACSSLKVKPFNNVLKNITKWLKTYKAFWNHFLNVGLDVSRLLISRQPFELPAPFYYRINSSISPP